MNVTTLNMTTLDGNVIIKKGGGGTPTPPSGGERDGWKYYLLNWDGLYDDPLYDTPGAIQAIRAIQEYFAALVVVDFSITAEISIGFSMNMQTENFQIHKYLALKYDGGRDLQTLMGMELTPKYLLEMLEPQFPFTKVLADNMTKCNRAEYEAKMKSN